MPDQDVPLHRVRGLVSGANWRLTKFTAAVPHHLTCGLCHVISCPAFLLPCLHTLCESCVKHSLNDGNTVCPFDEESFAVGDCQKFQWPPATADKLKACCWNEGHGCTFVGTLQAVLAHYEQECTFHALICPRCNRPVLYQDLPRHYRGCHGEAIELTAGDPPLRQGVAVSAQQIGRCIDELKALIMDPYQDRLPALQSKMNEVLEEARNIAFQVEAGTRASRESEYRLTEALEELSTTFGRNFQSQEALLRSTLNRNSQIGEFSVPGTDHDMQINAIVSSLGVSERRLSHQLAEATRDLSTIFAQKLQSQQRELLAQLKKMSDVEEMSNPGETGTTGANQMPWRLEKRHILRKLELIASDSHAYLELLRTTADQELKRPLVEYTPILPDNLAATEVLQPLIGKRESEEEGYIVSLTNIDDVVKSEKFIGLFTQWYRRDRYLQVAAYGFKTSSTQGLTVCLKWGTTLQGPCSAYPEARVCVKHPDDPEKENIQLKKLPRPGRRATLFGFQNNFGVYLSELERFGLLRDGKLTLVVSFKI